MRHDDDEEEGRPRFRIMHLTMVMLCLLFVAKMSEVVTGTKELLSVREAHAEDKAEEAKPEAAEETSDAKDAEGDTAAEEEKADAKDAEKPEAKEGEQGEGEGKPPEEEKTHGAGKLTVKEVEALKAREPGSEFTKTELDLLQNLTKRRQELDDREKELELKAKVLDATELRITNKVDEMKALQVELAKVVEQYNQKQNSEIMSLVKIYENMKPADAAAIFNEMDMPVLLEVIDKMSERKVAPVLAGMSPTRAKDVTQELAEMRRGRASLNADAAAAAAKP